VLLETRIDALDITVLKGGGAAVGEWATEHGFRLPPDAPEVLDFYANRSPIFMAAVFDADAAKARGQNVGDGTPVHLTIPTANPWVPIRILALGKTASDRVEADVYFLTDSHPSFLPYPGAKGMTLEHYAPASRSLLDDLRSDKGMEWVPQSAWLTKIAIDAAALQLDYDLAVDANGLAPSRIAAGFDAPAPTSSAPTHAQIETYALVGLALAAVGALALLRRPRTVHA
jgi:MYXO-CTERM domain-containing protein